METKETSPVGKLHSRRELAKMLGVHICTIRDWEKTGNAPARINLGPHKVAYSDKAIADYLAERTVAAG